MEVREKMKIKDKNKKIREDLKSRGIPEEKINEFIFKAYQVEYDGYKVFIPLSTEEKKIKRKKVDKKSYAKRKSEIKSAMCFRQKWREKRREYWRRREDWAEHYNKCEYANNWFEGCEQHHISKYIIVCIPKELHRSVYHSLKSGKGMLKINDLVYEWLDLQEK
jgi:hypothetical protein